VEPGQAAPLEPSGIVVEGRVVLEGEPGVRGLAGVDLHLWSDQGGLGRALSDMDGHFALSVPRGTDPCETWVQAVVPPGYALSRDVLDSCAEVGEEGTSLGGRGPQVLEFRAERDRRAPLSLLLVDRVTGEVLPHYVLALRRPDGGREKVASDETGHLVTSLAYPPGPVHYHELDVPVAEQRWPTPERTLDHRPGETDEPVRLPIRVGATVRLALDLPEGTGVGNLSCRLAVDSDRYTGRVLPGARAPLRRDEQGVWVRLPPFEMLYPWYESNPEPLWLELIDSARRAFASRPFPATHGLQEGVLELELTPLASVWGRVCDEEGQVVSGADVRLIASDGAREPWQLPRQKTSANGAFSFSGLFPGSYALRVVAREGLAEDLLEELVGGEDREVTVPLTHVPTHPVRGRVISESGDYQRRTFVRMEPLDEAHAAFNATLAVSWAEEEGRRVGRFDFGELPEGGYAVSVAGSQRHFEVEPPIRNFTLGEDAGTSTLEFLVRDDHPREELRVTVSDEIAPSALRYKIGDEIYEDELHPPESHLWGTLEDEEISWTLVVPGKRALYGDSSTLYREPGSSFLRVRLDVASLEEGWSRIIQVQDTKGEGLPGVGVLLDGRPVTSTQIDGGCVVDAQQAPEEITLKHAGSHTVSSVEDGPWLIFVVALR